MFMYYTVSYITGIIYAAVRQMPILFIQNQSVLFCNVWDSCSDVHIKKQICTQTCSQSSLCCFANANWTRAHFTWSITLKELLRCNKCILVHKVIYNKSAQYLRQLVHTGVRNDISPRNSNRILLKTELTFMKIFFAYSVSFCWNELPRSLKITGSVSTFNSKALQHFRTECNTYVFNLELYSI